MLNSEEQIIDDLTPLQANVLLVSIMLVALCGIVYELIIGTVSSYLLGNSVYQFSLTIGFFMSAMGVGSYVSRYIGKYLVQTFVYVEMVLAFIGSLCSISLFLIFPFAPWFYQLVMFSFIFAIGFLVGLEIPLLTRVLAVRRGTRKSIADVMSLDYIGALIGSVAFPLFLLPSLGLITSSFAIGLINIAVALVNVIWLRDHFKNFKIVLWSIGFITLALLVLTFSASRISSFAQQHLYFDQIVWKKNTKYQSLVITNNWPKGDLRLFIDGHLQFSELDEHRYHEALVHPVMSWSGSVGSILVLGGGDGLAVRELLKYSNIKSIDLVDLDPEMTKLGTDFPPLKKLNKNSLSDNRVRVYNDDAFNFVRETKKKYDRIIIDFPDPHNEAISKLYSVEFYAMLHRIMTEDGVLVSQSSSPFMARKTFWTVAITMEAIFPEVTSYNVTIPAFGIWGFNMAHKGEVGAFGLMPNDLFFMSQKVFTASMVFADDISKTPGLEVNSIFEPSLYQTYLNDLKNGPLGKR